MIILNRRHYALLTLFACILASCQTYPSHNDPATIAQESASVISASPDEETPEAWLPENLFENGQGNADVKYVKAIQGIDGSWTFHVTVSHPDQGWEDYADGWDILLPDGEVLKPEPQSNFSRPLLHPHVDEQPFTRSLSGIQIPQGIDKVLVRAHDFLDGFGGEVVTVNFLELSGANYLVEFPE